MTKKRSHDQSTSDERPHKTSRTDVCDHVEVLNQRYPETIPRAHVPPYLPASSPVSKHSASSLALPLLPSIPAGYLATAPFTHASTVDSKYSTKTHLSYERLEFLGDAYLEVIATRLVYSRFPQLLTGKQSQLRQSMVRNSTLAVFARGYNFGDRLKISQREAASGKSQEKILGDVFEAYVAAIVLSDPEGGFKTAEEWLTKLWAPMLLQVMHAGRSDAQVLEVDAKSLLSGKVETMEVRLRYDEEKQMVRTKDSVQQHFIAVYLIRPGCQPLKIGSGTGVGKTEAGMRAALDAMERNAAVVEEAAQEKENQKRARQEAAAAKAAAESTS